MMFLRQPAERHASLEFRLIFEGADRGEYPNRMRFSRSEIISEPVLTEVYESNDLERYLGFEQFKNALFILESSQDLELLSQEYQGKLADIKLTPVDRSRLEEEFRQKSEALRVSQYSLNFMTSTARGNIPPPLMNKILNDVLSHWAEYAAIRKGVLHYQVSVLTPNVLSKEFEEAEDYIVRTDILRGKIARILGNLDELVKLPGATVVRVGESRISLPEIRANLEDVARYRLEPLVALVRTSGVSRDPAIVARYLENRLLQIRLEREEAAGTVATLQESLRAYMTERGPAAASRAGGSDGAAGSPSPLPGAGTVIPQFGESFLDRLVTMSSQNNDLEYRQNLTDRVITAGQQRVILDREASYYESLMDTVRRSSSSAGGRTSGAELEKAVQTRFNEIHAAVDLALTQSDAVYQQISAQNLNPRTNLYTMTRPFTVTTVRARSLRLLAVYGIVAICLAMVLLPLGCLVHHYFKKEILPEKRSGAQVRIQPEIREREVHVERRMGV
jgi:hypothetical protein